LSEYENLVSNRRCEIEKVLIRKLLGNMLSHLTYKRDLVLSTETNLDSIFEDAEQVFIELSNSQRLDILYSLHKQELNLAGLSKQLAVTMQEVHRNLNRLSEAGLVEKKSNCIFFLTTFFNIIIRQI